MNSLHLSGITRIFELKKKAFNKNAEQPVADGEPDQMTLEKL